MRRSIATGPRPSGRVDGPGRRVPTPRSPGGRRPIKVSSRVDGSRSAGADGRFRPGRARRPPLRGRWKNGAARRSTGSGGRTVGRTEPSRVRALRTVPKPFQPAANSAERVVDRERRGMRRPDDRAHAPPDPVLVSVAGAPRRLTPSVPSSSAKRPPAVSTPDFPPHASPRNPLSVDPLPPACRSPAAELPRPVARRGRRAPLPAGFVRLGADGPRQPPLRSSRASANSEHRVPPPPAHRGPFDDARAPTASSSPARAGRPLSDATLSKLLDEQASKPFRTVSDQAPGTGGRSRRPPPAGGGRGPRAPGQGQGADRPREIGPARTPTPSDGRPPLAPRRRIRAAGCGAGGKPFIRPRRRAGGSRPRRRSPWRTSGPSGTRQPLRRLNRRL